MSLVIVAMKCWTVTVTIPTTSSSKQLRLSAIVFTRDGETSTEEEENVVNWRFVMIKQGMCGVKLAKTKQ